MADENAGHVHLMGNSTASSAAIDGETVLLKKCAAEVSQITKDASGAKPLKPTEEYVVV